MYRIQATRRGRRHTSSADTIPEAVQQAQAALAEVTGPGHISLRVDGLHVPFIVGLHLGRRPIDSAAAAAEVDAIARQLSAALHWQEDQRRGR